MKNKSKQIKSSKLHFGSLDLTRKLSVCANVFTFCQKDVHNNPYYLFDVCWMCTDIPPCIINFDNLLTKIYIFLKRKKLRSHCYFYFIFNTV